MAILQRAGLRVDHEVDLGGLTPDVVVLDDAGRPLVLLEVANRMRPDAVESTDQLWRSFRDRVRRIPAPWGVVVRAASPHPPGPPPEEAKRLAQEPVSYTHLDVYKRQKKGGGDARGLHGPLPVKFDDDNIIELDPPTPRPVTAGKWSRVARPPCSASRKGRSWGLDLSSGAKLDTGLSRKSRATPCGIVHSRTSSLAGYNVTLSPTRQ